MGGSTGCRREGLCQGRPHQGYTRDLSSRAKGTDSDGDAPMSFPAESSPQAQGSVPEGPPLGNGSAHEAGSLGVLSRPLDPEEFRAHAHRMVDYMADYYKSVHSMPVRSTVQVRCALSPSVLSPSVLFLSVMTLSVLSPPVQSSCCDQTTPRRLLYSRSSASPPFAALFSFLECSNDLRHPHECGLIHQRCATCQLATLASIVPSSAPGPCAAEGKCGVS